MQTKKCEKRNTMMLGLDYIIAPQVPRGLGSAVEGLAREILRQRPQDIYTFAAHHFERLIELRDKGRIAGTIVGIVDCKPLNGRDRLSTWTGLNNNDIDDYRNCSANLRSGKRNVSVNGTTSIRKQPVTTPIMRKIPKKKRQATSRSGWSINEAVKVFKKYKYANYIEDWRPYDIEANGRAIEKGNAGDSEQCSPRHLEKLVHGRLLRTSSAGNVLVKNTECLLEENKGEFRSFVPYCKRSLTNTEHECSRHCRFVNTLNRQGSADQVVGFPTRFRETEEQSCIVVGRRRSRSLVNGGGSSNNEELAGIKVGERSGRLKGDQSSRNCHSRAHRETVAEDLQNEKRELEQKLYSPEEVDTKLNMRLGRKGEQEFIFDDVAANTATFVEHMTSVVLPSVVTRQKYTKNNAGELSDQQYSSNNLTLPPISSETLTSNERIDHLALPPLLVAEDVRLNSRVTYSYNSAGSNLDRCGGEESVEFAITNRLELTNSDSVYSSCKCDENEIFAFAKSPFEQHSTVTKDDLDIMQDSSPREKDVEESFKDSLNVTPDLVDAPQRPDSLEHFEDRSSTPMIMDNERESGGPELRGEQAHYPSNELKRQLIEIEMVERNIESTLVSSQSISGCDDGFEGSRLIASPTIGDFKSDRSNSTRENGTNLVCDADTRPSNDANKIDLSCYDLTAGVPSEMPTILTTVIIPNNHRQRVHDVLLKRGFEEMMNQGRRSDELPSPRSADTREEFREECQNYADPFGEYVNPEIFDNSKSIVGACFQQDVRNAVSRSAVYQDLENINEEEEDENAKFSNNVARYNDIEPSYLNDVAESAERKESIERKVELLKFSNHGKANDPMKQTSFYIPMNVTHTRTDEHVERQEQTKHISAGMSSNSGERESAQCNNRSCNRSLSSEDIAPYIPELNLDSLQDVTISSFERNDSKYLQHNTEVEDYDITSCDDENISSSSGNTLISEKNMITLSSGDDSSREQQFNNRKVLATRPDCESDVLKCYKGVYQECKSIDMPAADKNGKTSLSIEENIADVLLDNFTVDTLTFRELTLQSGNQPRLEQIGNDGHTYKLESQGKENGDQVEEEASNSGQMRSLSFSNKRRNKLSGHQRKCQEVKEFLTSGRIIVTGQKDGTISGLRHTGEFHDSFPLSLTELTTSAPTSNVYFLKAVCEGADHSPAVQANFVKNQLFTTFRDMSVINYKPLQSTVSYATDMSNSFRLFDNKPSWIESWLNHPKNIIYVGPIFKETFIDRTIVSLADTILGPGHDDCREPLALDNTPKPIIIEEISNTQDEREKWSDVISYKADTYFPASFGECSTKGDQNPNNDEAGRKGLFHGSLSSCEVKHFTNDNDSLTNVIRYSPIPRRNSNAAWRKGNAKEYQADESIK